jgi:O-methyltransferase
MMKLWQLKQWTRSGLNRVGLDVTLCRAGGFPYDFDEFHIDIIKRVKPFTMTSPERLFGLIEAIRYLVHAGIKGDVIECGVYKGGSMMAAALSLLSERAVERDLYLYDTFSGMTEPTDVDVDFHGRRPTSTSKWAIASEETVREALCSTGYPPSKMHFIKGRVEDTLPGQAPDQISLLRLDTDWYASTRHELIHLFPRLVPGGVLIVDDYGQYRGSRKAVDEYFAATPVLLQRMDFSGRMCLKR